MIYHPQGYYQNRYWNRYWTLLTYPATEYLFLDQFLTDRASPLGSVLACDPGPGSWSVTDPSNTQYTAMGRYMASGEATGGTQGVFSGTFPHSPGRIFGFTSWSSARRAYFGSTFGDDSLGSIYGNTITCGSEVAAGITYEGGYIGIIRSETGRVYFINYQTRKLLWVSSDDNKNTDDAGMSLARYDTEATPYINAFVADLPTPWITDYGIAEDYDLSADANTVINAPANVMLEATWVAATGETFDLMFRRTDDDNCWIARSAQSGTIKLIRVEEGSETEVDSENVTFTNGTAYRIFVIADESAFGICIDGVLHIYSTSQTFNQTVEGAKTGCAVTHFIAWPRDISGQAKAALDEVFITQDDWYTAADAPANGIGTFDYPYPFETALLAASLHPGQTLHIRGGTYSLDPTQVIDCTLVGTADRPITVQPYLNERVIISGGISLRGAHNIWDGKLSAILRSNYWTTRKSDYTGSYPPDLPYTSGFTLLGNGDSGLVLRNWIVHDIGGFYQWSPAINAKVENCVIYNIGWEGPDGDRGHGHLFYTQNNTGVKTYTGNIAFNSFSTGMKIYSEGSVARNYFLEGNTFFNSSILHAGVDDYGMNYWIQYPTSVPEDRYTFIRNRDYHSLRTGEPNWIGLYDYIYGVTLTDNYFQSGIIKDCEVLSETGNYYGDYVAGNTSFVEKNTTIDTAGIITVYNQSRADSIPVDLSAITDLQPGHSVRVWNVQAGVDVAGDKRDTVDLVLDSDMNIVIDMRQSTHNSTAVVYGNWPSPATTFPEFGTFVFEAVTTRVRSMSFASSSRSMTFTPSTRSIVFS